MIYICTCTNNTFTRPIADALLSSMQIPTMLVLLSSAQLATAMANWPTMGLTSVTILALAVVALRRLNVHLHYCRVVSVAAVVGLALPQSLFLGLLAALLEYGWPTFGKIPLSYICIYIYIYICIYIYI